MSILKTSLSKASTFARKRAAAGTLARRALGGAAAVATAGVLGAMKIKKASNALNKSIDAMHTKSSMDDHQRMLNRSMARKEAATKLRKAKQPKAPQGVPGARGQRVTM